eukprot:g2539.t1
MDRSLLPEKEEEEEEAMRVVMKTTKKTRFTPRVVVGIMAVTNVFNYVDRMIVSGAPTEIESFVHDTMNVDVTEESVYLGYLMSAFIGGFCVANLLFGHAVRYRSPFKLVAVGLSIWTVAIFLSGLAKPLNSFWLLIAARGLSGVGEAALQTVVPAFIDAHVDDAQKSSLLAVFYLGFPVGGALGFLWGSTMAATAGWHWAFWLEIPLILPVILICLVLPYPAPPPPKENTRYQHRLSFRSDIFPILRSVEYVLVTVGSAAMIALISSFATYAPLFMLGLGFFEKESDASFTFGALTCATGLVGTLLGGLINDFSKRKFRSEGEGNDRGLNMHNAMVATLQMTITAAIALVCFAAGVYSRSKSAFLAFMFFGELALFMPTALQVEVLLLFVDNSRRGLAMGLYNFLGHVLGDIPSPIIVGALKDHWAPKCNSVDGCCASESCAPRTCCVFGDLVKNCTTHERSVLNVDCPDDSDGLRLTLLVAVFWLFASILCWGALHLQLRCCGSEYLRDRRLSRSQESAHPSAVCTTLAGVPAAATTGGGGEEESRPGALSDPLLEN